MVSYQGSVGSSWRYHGLDYLFLVEINEWSIPVLSDHVMFLVLYRSWRKC